MTNEELQEALRRCGCPEERLESMAAQLDKRAGQLVAERGQTREQALAYLLGLMRQGWAAGGGERA